MIKKRNFFQAILLTFLLILPFFSCANFINSFDGNLINQIPETPENEQIENQNGEGKSTGSGNSGSGITYCVSGSVGTRGALPNEMDAAINSSDESDDGVSRSAITDFPSTFMYIVSLSKDGSLIESTQASTSKAFSFIIEEVGVYTFSASIYNASTQSECVDSNKLFYGETDFNINQDNSELQIETTAYSSSSARGSILLPISIDSGTGDTAITQYSYTLTKQGDTSSEVVVDKTSIASNSFTINHEDIPVGVYTLNLSFFNSKDTLVLKYVDKVNVFNSMTTNKWIASSTSPYINESGSFIVPTTAVTIFNQDQFYVDPDAASSGTYGSMFDPFKTIDEAYALITAYQRTSATILIKAGSTSTVSNTISPNETLTTLTVMTYGNSNETSIENNATLSKSSSSSIDSIFALYSGSAIGKDLELYLYNLNISCDETCSVLYCSDTDNTCCVFLNYCSISSTASAPTSVRSPLMFYSGQANIENCEISGQNYGKGLIYFCQTSYAVTICILSSSIHGNTANNCSALYVDNKFSANSYKKGVSLEIDSSTISDSYYGLYISTQEFLSGSDMEVISIKNTHFTDLISNSIYTDYDIKFADTNYFTNTDSSSLENSAIYLNWHESFNPVLDIESATAFNGASVYLTLPDDAYQENNQLITGTALSSVYSSIQMVNSGWVLNSLGKLIPN